MSVKSEQTGQPAVVAPDGALGYKILGYGPLMPALCQRKKVERQKVLVEGHIVGEILHGSDARQRHPTRTPFHGKAVGNRRAPVETGVIVVHATRQVRSHPVLLEYLAGSLAYGIGSIWVSALPQYLERGRILHPQFGRRVPHGLPPQRALVLAVAFLTVVLIAVKSVGMAVVAAHCHAETGIDAPVVRHPCAQAVAASILQHRAQPLHLQWRQRVDINQATHGIASVERRLGASQQLDTLHIAQVEIKIVLVEIRHIVDIEPYHRLVDARPDASYIYRRGHPRPIVGDIEVWGHLAHILDSSDIETFHLAFAHYRGHQRQTVEPGSRLDCGHPNLAESHSAVGPLGRRGQRLCRGYRMGRGHSGAHNCGGACRHTNQRGSPEAPRHGFPTLHAAKLHTAVRSGNPHLL